MISVITACASAIVAIGVILGGARWLFGQILRVHVEALQNNTEAITRLSGIVELIDRKVDRHEWILERLKGGSKDH